MTKVQTHNAPAAAAKVGEAMPDMVKQFTMLPFFDGELLHKKTATARLYACRFSLVPPLQRISDLSPLYHPLHFPMRFPCVDLG